MIDSHTHRYPPEVYSNPRKFAEKQGESHWLELVDPSQGSKLQGWASRQRMITDMDAASISQAVLLGWYWENPNTCFEHNNWHAQWIKEDPERFYAFASIHPVMPEPIEELKRRLDQGFVGIGECHPGVQGFTIKNPSWIKCVEFACENGWPINFHVTEPVGHDYPGRTATPFEDFHWLAREYPTLKIILSHAGGLFPFYELNPRIQKELNNVYYDLAACPLLYDSSLYRRLIDVVGYHKILWGTDYPLRIYPNIQSTPDFSTFRNEILSVAKLNKNEEEAIFHQNILSLLPC